jgi:hypothetical protein
VEADRQARREQNRQNARRSTGPRDSGRTRLNATKHGLASLGITDLDNRARLTKLTKQLRQEFEPHGTLEAFIVDQIALGLIRIERASKFEGQHIHTVPNFRRASLTRLFLA